MVVYAYIFLLIFLGLFFESFKTKANVRSLIVLFEVFILFHLVFFTAIRTHTGTDYHSYVDIFNIIPPFSSGQSLDANIYVNIEPGFKIMTAIMKEFDSLILYFFVVAMLSFMPLYAGLKSVSNLSSMSIFLALFMYCCIFMISYNYNAVRQAISMGIFVWSLPYIVSNRTLSVLALSLLATMFHSSGVFIAISYLGVRLLLVDSSLKVVIGLLGCILVYVLDLLPMLLGSIGINTERWVQAWGSIDSVSFLLRCVIIALFCFPFRFYESSRLNSVLFTLYFHGFAFYVMLASIGMMATRINMFYRVLEILIIPLILSQSKFVTNKYFYFGVFLALGFLVFYTTLNEPINHYKSAYIGM